MRPAKARLGGRAHRHSRRQRLAQSGGEEQRRSSSSASSALHSAPLVTPWSRASTSSRYRSELQAKRPFAELRTHQYSRVASSKGEERRRKSAGYLYAKDFLVDPANARSLLDSACAARSSSCRRPGPARRAPPMQREQIPIAVVVDEYGGRAASSRWRTCSRRSSARSATSSTSSTRASRRCRATSTRGTWMPAPRSKSCYAASASTVE